MYSNDGFKKGFVNKLSLEWIFLILLFLISFINTFSLLVFFISILLLLRQKEVGAIKIINIITLRTIINPGLAIDVGTMQNLKWLVLFVCSFYLVLSIRKLSGSNLKKVKLVLLPLLLFSLFNILVALIFSSLPIIAIFKLISYSFIFSAVIIGVGYTISKIHWIDWYIKVFSFVYLLSIPFVSSPIGYLRNGRGFQGLFNHPNMFGIVSVLFVALILTKSQLNKNLSHFHFTLMVLVMGMIFLSQSRTSLMSSLLLILIYIFLVIIKRLSYLKIVFISASIIILLVFSKSLVSLLMDFLAKGQTSGDILISRASQVSTLLTNFYSNPLFGTGFAVPVLPYRYFGFSTNFIVEPGNIVLAVLSYSGIIGFILFIIYMLQVLRTNKTSLHINIFLFLAPLLISMGEMVFFSSNNIGIWCYMFLAIYMFESRNEGNNSKELQKVIN
ncbi:O-antigen ligase family protein [[Bacillus] enclensis]|uniref:O-antigen ligase family protein n=1 Tax=[Bacillus] enclensis TaxID=1402860 RepID=UPI0018DDCB13|nr:O-antigen ligase family protein [[Bacillus] enclensis]MBH9967914.1 O-antigen ligase family protein [[Bacillus] enclensis]